MSTKEINGVTLQMDEDGYMADASQWNEGIAKELCKEVEINELTDDHFKVINFIRKENDANGAIPTLRKIGKQSGVSLKELYSLFPDGPVKKAALIAGLSKPKSCV